MLLSFLHWYKIKKDGVKRSLFSKKNAVKDYTIQLKS